MASRDVTDVTLIVDDSDPEIQYHCPVTHETVKGSYYENTWTTIKSLSCGQQSGWFSHVFNGTQTRIWASASEANQNYSVKIDDGPFIIQSGDGYFKSPVLQDGEHTVVYAAGAMSLFPTFDYLTVAAGPSTQLFGRTVIVDDSENALEYSGGWSTQSETPLLLDRPSAVYQNTTHWSGSVGDTFSVQFNGSSVSVYGVIPNNTDSGNSSAAYIVDGVSTILPIPPSSNQVQPMVQLFHADLDAGTHTLVFNLTELAPAHVIGIDFVLYNSSVHNTAPIGSVHGPSPVTAGAASLKKTHHMRTIVGATLGSLAGVVLVGLLLFLYRRRRSRNATKASNWNVVTTVNQ
ncbi:hypothetical protein B0H17DRAFT_947594 [Mycena rosella]|uniref:Transmembrane protein n=1 Tax=Mycena rosella TaxID=1033263 RepID=A0AAD7G9C4_MYCRO|nr:hypothetical protein B0H17DRAFT_947594 [Mycena rosella]